MAAQLADALAQVPGPEQAAALQTIADNLVANTDALAAAIPANAPPVDEPPVDEPPVDVPPTE